MDRTWLTRRVSLSELGDNWGYLQREWDALRSEMREGDELWEFASPQSSWDALAGRAGVALVRGGQVLSQIVTIVS
jgi:hypothetical protein